MEKLTQESRVRQIAVERIEASPFQARAFFHPADLEALAQSIAENGILQPLSVRRGPGGRYQLIAGERRLRAARQLGMEKVPCIVCTAGDVQSHLLGLTENLQRQNLTPFEEARAMQQLIALWGCSQAQAAKQLGIAQPTLANKLRLLLLSQEQQQFCVEHGLTERHARAVLRLEEEKARQLVLEKAVRGQLTVAATEALVEKLLAQKQAPARRGQMKGAVRDVRLFVNTLDRAVNLIKSAGLPATATRNDGEGYIEYVVRIPTTPAPQPVSAGKAG